MAGRDNGDQRKSDIVTRENSKSGSPDFCKHLSAQVRYAQFAPTRKPQVGWLRFFETPIGVRRESATRFRGGRMR